MKSIVLSILVLIAVSSYSQDSYPKKIVINSDTIVAITGEQSREVTIALIERGYLDQLTDSLEKKVELQKESIEILKSSSKEKTEKISYLNRVIRNDGEIADRLEEDLVVSREQTQKEKTKGKIARTVLGISLGANIILTLLSLGK